MLSHARGSKLNEHTTIDNYFAQALGTEACKILYVSQRFDGLSCVSILVCFLLTSDIVVSRPRGSTFGNGLPSRFHPRNMSEALSDFVGGGGERPCCHILGPVTCVSRELCCRGSMRRWVRWIMKVLSNSDHTCSVIVQTWAFAATSNQPWPQGSEMAFNVLDQSVPFQVVVFICSFCATRFAFGFQIYLFIAMPHV